MHPHFSRPCTLISHWIAWPYKKLRLAYTQRLYSLKKEDTNTHTHTLDLKRENHRKSKKIKINANMDFAEHNLKLWILFKLIVSNPFEHEQRLCVVKVSGLDLL